MFNKHLLKVLSIFAVIVVVGLIGLVVINHYDQKGVTESSVGGSRN